MKTHCHRCRARYSIPDERVVGRVVKVRCKRCSAVLEVIGPTPSFDIERDPLPPTLTAARAYDEQEQEQSLPARVPLEAQAIWWAAIGGKPHGPYTRGEVEELIDRGDVHARTRMWRAPWREWERVAENAALAWAYQAVIERVGRDVGALGDAGLAFDGEHFFPDPTLKSGWIILDEETQRYLETCAQRGWRDATALEPLDEPALAAPAPVGVDDRSTVWPAVAAACASLVLGVAGTMLLVEGTLLKLVA